MWTLLWTSLWLAASASLCARHDLGRGVTAGLALLWCATLLPAALGPATTGLVAMGVIADGAPRLRGGSRRGAPSTTTADVPG